MEKIDTDYKRRACKNLAVTIEECANREVASLTWRPLKHNLVPRLLTFTKVINVGHVTVGSPLVIGQRGGLSVGLVTNVTRVRLVVGVHMMFV